MREESLPPSIPACAYGLPIISKQTLTQYSNRMRFNKVVEKAVNSEKVESLLYLEGLEESPLLLLKDTKEVNILYLKVPFSLLKKMGMNLLKFAVLTIPKYRGDLENQKRKLARKEKVGGILRLPYEDTPDWAIWPIILQRQLTPKKQLLMLDVDPEGILEHWANKLYNYPFLVREAETSETQIEGEIFLGFPHEHDPYLQESTID